jgi:hypothetical protein
MIVTPIPFKKPQKVPAKRVKIITVKEELVSTNKPPNAQEKAAIEPTDKSISPRIMTIVIPKAIIPKTITVRIIFCILLKSKKAGLINTAKQQSIKNRISRLTLFPVFFKKLKFMKKTSPLIGFKEKVKIIQ